jgi:hypothetical protein
VHTEEDWEIAREVGRALGVAQEIPAG